MLKIKLEQDSNTNSYYRIKINGELLDYGFLENKEELLCYKGIKFSDKEKTYISISCSDDRFLRVNEISFYTSRVVSSKDSKYKNWNTDHIASGVVENINEVMQGDFSNVILSDAVGGNREWFFVIEIDETISLWDPDISWRNQPLPPPPQVPADEFGPPRPDSELCSDVYKFDNGITYDGEFHRIIFNDKTIDIIVEGFGKMTLVDKTLLDGEFINGNFISGTKTNPDKTKEIGYFLGDNNNIRLIKGIYIDIEGLSHKINTGEQHNKGENQ